MDRLDPDEPPAAEVRRVAHGLLAEAAVSVETIRHGAPAEVGVHTARRRLKQSRALLKMIRGSIGRETYTRDNAAMRDVGRRLSRARDASVLVGTAQTIVADVPDAHELVHPIELDLEARRAAMGRDFQDAELAGVLASLGDLATAPERWRLEGIGWGSMVEGLASAYERGHDAFEVAAEEGSMDTFHELRKRTKDVRYQTELLRDAWTPVLSGAAEGAHDLSDVLGEAQDLHVLLETLRAGRGSVWNVTACNVLVAAALARLDRARRDAIVLATMVYAERPKAFRKRVRAYTSGTGGTDTSAAA